MRKYFTTTGLLIPISLLMLLVHTAQSQSPTIITLRLLTHNVYGKNKLDCKTRYKFLGEQIAAASPHYDIIGLQEFYDSPFDVTCEPHHLNNAIWSSGFYGNPYNYNRYNPEVSLGANGGVGIFTLHNITKFGDWVWMNDNQKIWEAKEGFIFARLKVSNPNMYIDVYVVHLNSGEDQNRKLQLIQLAGMIEKYSKNSGGLVFVMGDFNIGGPPKYNGNRGYADIMEILKNPIDLWTEAHNGENGFTYDCTVNGTARGVENGCTDQERIDYIFNVTDRKFTNALYRMRISDPAKVNVVQWQTPESGDRRSRYVSDHFGLEATVEVYKIRRADRRRQARQGDPTRGNRKTRER